MGEPIHVVTPPIPCTIELGPWWKPPKITLTDEWFVRFNQCVYHIPPGFISDGASIPHFTGPRQIITLVMLAALALTRFSKLRSIRAAVMHDYFYACPNMILRGHADYYFRLVLKHDGIGLLGRWLAWAGVRIGGWAHYGRGPCQAGLHRVGREDGAWWFPPGWDVPETFLGLCKLKKRHMRIVKA